MWPWWALQLSPWYGHHDLTGVFIDHNLNVQYQIILYTLQTLAACLGWPISCSVATMLWKVIIIFRHYRAHELVIHVASHVDHERRVARFLFPFMHMVLFRTIIVMVFCLVARSLAWRWNSMSYIIILLIVIVWVWEFYGRQYSPVDYFLYSYQPSAWQCNDTKIKKYHADHTWK